MIKCTMRTLVHLDGQAYAKLVMTTYTSNYQFLRSSYRLRVSTYHLLQSSVIGSSHASPLPF